MSNASGDPVKGGHEADWTTITIPDSKCLMCAENFVTKVCLRDQDFKNLPPAPQRLLGNPSELKGKLWRMRRQESVQAWQEIPRKMW